MSWRDLMPVHPAADIFPMMTDDELVMLGEDIKANGLTSPIAIVIENDKPMLLDGRNRLDAMERVGLDIGHVVDGPQKGIWYLEIGPDLYPVELIDGNPAEYVASANLHRRHLTAETKRDLIAKLLKESPERSDRAVGKVAQVDHKTVAVVRRQEETRGNIPHVEKRVDTKGRRQPTSKNTANIGKRAAAPPAARPKDKVVTGSKATATMRAWAKDVVANPEKHCEGVHPLAQEIARQEAQEPTKVEPVPIVPEPVDGAEIAPPDVLEDNIRYTINRINENARVINKLLKASALDREAAARINTEIDKMMGKWRSIQSTLAAKAKASEAPPTVTEQPESSDATVKVESSTTAPEPVERDNAVDLRELRAEAAKVGYRIHKDRDGYKVVGQDGDTGFGSSDLATIGQYIRGEPIPVHTPCGRPLFTINAKPDVTPPVPETSSGEMPDVPPFLDRREMA